VRLLDRLGIRFELRSYDVDPDDLAAETVADVLSFRTATIEILAKCLGQQCFSASYLEPASFPDTELSTSIARAQTRAEVITGCSACSGHQRPVVSSLRAWRCWPCQGIARSLVLTPPGQARRSRRFSRRRAFWRAIRRPNSFLKIFFCRHRAQDLCQIRVPRNLTM
jgi:hypothetical protein